MLANPNALVKVGVLVLNEELAKSRVVGEHLDQRI